MVQVVVDKRLSGIVTSNTTTDPQIKDKYGAKDEPGGMSGDIPEFVGKTDAQIAFIRREVEGVPNFEIQGVGGVNSLERALAKFLAGADVVQIVTGIREVGPALPGRINRELAAWMDKQCITYAEEVDLLVGSRGVL